MTHDSPAAADAWLFTCISGTLGHLLFAQADIVAMVPPFLQETSSWVAIIGLLGVVVRAWGSRQSHSRALVDRDAQIIDRDTRIAELGIKVGGLQDSLGKCEVLLEIYRGLCKSAECPLRAQAASKAQG